MSKEKKSILENEVNRVIEQIEKITGSTVNSPLLSTKLLKEVISLRENNESEAAICRRISQLTGLDESDPRIKAILKEIEDKPFENIYQPFNNDLFAKLKKDLEK